MFFLGVMGFYIVLGGEANTSLSSCQRPANRVLWSYLVQVPQSPLSSGLAGFIIQPVSFGAVYKVCRHLLQVLIQITPILCNTVGTEAKVEERILGELVTGGADMGVEEGWDPEPRGFPGS